ncbi:hypothetical protein AN476_05355 [Phaeobacter sp. 11ANDIMAR09]|nr:hypothetical protein AN476_05355 [Phaeobacter sp. 11ANDIMAR09]
MPQDRAEVLCSTTVSRSNGPVIDPKGGLPPPQVHLALPAAPWRPWARRRCAAQKGLLRGP